MFSFIVTGEFEDLCHKREMEKRPDFRFDQLYCRVFWLCCRERKYGQYWIFATSDFFCQVLQYFSFICPPGHIFPHLENYETTFTVEQRSSRYLTGIKSETRRHKIRVSLPLSQQWKSNLNGPQLAPSRNWSFIPEKVDRVEF